MTLPSVRARNAFTLVELLVVIAIIGVLVALLLPAVQAAREAANRASCNNKLKQLAIGLHNHHDTYKRFPPGAEQDVYPRPRPTTGTLTSFRGTSWLVHLLPFIEQKSLYDQYDFTVAYNVAPNGTIVGTTVVDLFYCPSGPRPKTYLDPNSGVTNNPSTHYYGVMGPGGPNDNFQVVYNGITYTFRQGDSGGNAAWSGHGILSQMKETSGSISTDRYTSMADITDGTSNTLMIGERSVHLPAPKVNSYRTWIRGQNGGSGTTKNVKFPINSTDYDGSANFNDISFGSNHPGGCNFALGDGSVRFISENFDLTTYMLTSSMNSGEMAPIP